MRPLPSQYDKDGLPTFAADSDSSVSWSYDGLGRLIKETQSNAAAPLRFFYDTSRGHLIRRTLGSQISESLGYNEDGALISMTYQHFGVSRSVRINRDELGRPVSTKISSGNLVLKSFDGGGRLSSLETKNRNQDTVGSFEFEYDPNSNITVIDQMVDGAVTPKNYIYDAENRLTQAEHGAETETWNLDLLGNWLGNGKVYNNANQLTEDQDYFYSYDLRGNLIQKSAKLGGAITNFAWDYFNRLVEVETATKRVSYRYDPTGRRTERTMEDLTSSTTKTSRWTYLKEDQWAESNELDQVLAVTLNGESIDDILSMTVKDQNQASPGIALDPVRDHLGSVHGWTEASSGAVIQKQGYSAYGETTVTNSSGLLSQLGSQRGYTSRELDEDTNLYYNRARWLSLDPIGFDGRDSNLFRYVRSNPLRYSDPEGKTWWAPIIPILPVLYVGAAIWIAVDLSQDNSKIIHGAKKLQNLLSPKKTGSTSCQ